MQTASDGASGTQHASYAGDDTNFVGSELDLSGPCPQNGITYQTSSALVMTSIPNVYLIWYGTFSSTTKTVITDLINGMGGSAWYRINSTYPSCTTTTVGPYVRNALNFKDQYTFPNPKASIGPW